MKWIAFSMIFLSLGCSDPTMTSKPDFSKGSQGLYMLQSKIDPSQFIPANRIRNLDESDTQASNPMHLVFIDSVDELRALGRAAHADHQPGIPCGRLIKVSDDFNLAKSAGETRKGYQSLIPTWLHSSEIKAIGEKIQRSQIEEGIKALESLGSRDAYGANARAASDKVEAMFLAAIGQDGRFKLERLAHPDSDSDQDSIIIRLEGDSEETLIFGAHLDSINSLDHDLNAPGADDDATGIASLVEMVRVISEDRLSFQRSIEWHAYAIEEYGLIGSKTIADDYAAANKLVTAMFQIDMTGYDIAGTGIIHLIETDTDPVLVRDLRNLINGYLGGTFTTKPLSSGTSDHKSFHRNGYATAFPFENPEAYNQHIHTETDRWEKIQNSTLLLPIAKLAMLFALHHAGGKTSLELSSAQERLFVEFKTKLSVGIQESGVSSYDLFIAGDQAFSRIEVCTILESNIFTCRTGEPVYESGLAYQKNGSFFYVIEGAKLKADASYGIFAFLQDQAPIAGFRAIQLQSP